MKKRIVFLIIVLAILALLLLKFCNNGFKPEPPQDGSKPSAAILKAEILDRSDSEIRFAVDFGVFRDSKNTEDGISKKEVSIDTLKRPFSSFALKAFEKSAKSTKEPFSAIVLMDQSGSMNSNDRDKKRFKAANIFNKNFGHENYLMLWAFGVSRKGYGAIGQGFVKDTILFKKQLDSLEVTRAGGGSPLFQAQDSTLQYLQQYAKTPIKAVVTLTDGMAGNQKAYEQAVASSLQHDIPLYNISLKKDSEVLRLQALETNGAYIYVDDTEQFLSLFGNLGSLIDHSATIYHTEWIAKPLKGDFSKLKRIKHKMNIRLPYGETIALPFELMINENQ